jgi:hypothetical protein
MTHMIQLSPSSYRPPVWVLEKMMMHAKMSAKDANLKQRTKLVRPTILIYGRCAQLRLTIRTKKIKYSRRKIHRRKSFQFISITLSSALQPVFNSKRLPVFHLVLSGFLFAQMVLSHERKSGQTPLYPAFSGYFRVWLRSCFSECVALIECGRR